MTNTPGSNARPSTLPDDEQTPTKSVSTDTDRAIVQGVAGGAILGASVTVFSWGLIPKLDQVAVIVAGVGGFLGGMAIPLAVVSLLLPFLQTEWAVLRLEDAGKWKKASGAVLGGVHVQALTRPRVAAATAGYILVVQLASLITEYLQDDSLEVVNVYWTPAAGFVTCLAGLFVLQAMGSNKADGRRL